MPEADELAPLDVAAGELAPDAEAEPDADAEAVLEVDVAGSPTLAATLNVTTPAVLLGTGGGAVLEEDPEASGDAAAAPEAAPLAGGVTAVAPVAASCRPLRFRPDAKEASVAEAAAGSSVYAAACLKFPLCQAARKAFAVCSASPVRLVPVGWKPLGGAAACEPPLEPEVSTSAVTTPMTATAPIPLARKTFRRERGRGSSPGRGPAGRRGSGSSQLERTSVGGGGTWP